MPSVWCPIPILLMWFCLSLRKNKYKIRWLVLWRQWPSSECISWTKTIKKKKKMNQQQSMSNWWCPNYLWAPNSHTWWCCRSVCGRSQWWQMSFSIFINFQFDLFEFIKSDGLCVSVDWIFQFHCCDELVVMKKKTSEPNDERKRRWERRRRSYLSGKSNSIHSFNSRCCSCCCGSDGLRVLCIS